MSAMRCRECGRLDDPFKRHTCEPGSRTQYVREVLMLLVIHPWFADPKTQWDLRRFLGREGYEVRESDAVRYGDEYVERVRKFNQVQNPSKG